MNQVLAKIIVAGCIYSLCLYAVRATDIKIADDKSVVLAELGSPVGHTKSGSREVWVYHQGSIELLYGKVVSIELLTPAEINAREVARRQRERRKQDQRQLERARGESEKQRIMRDPDYAKLSPDQLMRVWNLFRLRFPDTPIDGPAYKAALTKLKAAPKPSANSVKSVEEDFGPPPKISGKRKRKLMRAGKWKWGSQKVAQTKSM